MFATLPLSLASQNLTLVMYESLSGKQENSLSLLSFATKLLLSTDALRSLNREYTMLQTRTEWDTRDENNIIIITERNSIQWLLINSLSDHGCKCSISEHAIVSIGFHFTYQYTSF